MDAGAAEVREACKYCQLLGCPKAATVPVSHEKQSAWTTSNY